MREVATYQELPLRSGGQHRLARKLSSFDVLRNSVSSSIIGISDCLHLGVSRVGEDEWRHHFIEAQAQSRRRFP